MLTTKQVFEELADLKVALHDMVLEFANADAFHQYMPLDEQPRVVKRAMELLKDAPFTCPNCGENLKFKIYPPVVIHRWMCPCCGYSKSIKESKS